MSPFFSHNERRRRTVHSRRSAGTISCISTNKSKDSMGCVYAWSSFRTACGHSTVLRPSLPCRRGQNCPQVRPPTWYRARRWVGAQRRRLRPVTPGSPAVSCSIHTNSRRDRSIIASKPGIGASTIFHAHSRDAHADARSGLTGCFIHGDGCGSESATSSEPGIGPYAIPHAGPWDEHAGVRADLPRNP